MSHKAAPDKARVLPFSRPPAAADQHFVREVFERHHEALQRFILRLGVDVQNSLDITQEVYLRIARQNEPEKLKNAPRTYLYTIATNLVRDQIRKSHRQLEDQHTAQDESTLPADVAAPDDAADMYRKLEKLKQALLELPANKQRLLLLSRFHGLSCRQIAEQTGTPFRTVQRHLNDALLFCKSKLRYYRE